MDCENWSRAEATGQASVNNVLVQIEFNFELPRLISIFRLRLAAGKINPDDLCTRRCLDVDVKRAKSAGKAIKDDYSAFAGHEIRILGLPRHARAPSRGGTMSKTEANYAECEDEMFSPPNLGLIKRFHLH